jgi:hypothetical protein
MLIVSRTRNVLLWFVLAFACGQALAQFGGGTRHGRGGSQGEGSSGSQREGSSNASGVTRMSANDRIRIQITDLRLALKLTPEQNPLFDTYQSKVFALLSPWSAPPDLAPSQVPEALTRIAQKVAVARGRWTQTQEVYEAAAKLYAVLAPEQREVADRMLADTVPSPAAGGWGSDIAGPPGNWQH